MPPRSTSQRSGPVESSGTSRRRNQSSGGPPCEERAMSEANGHGASPGVLRESPVWPRQVIDEIQLKAQLGRYHIQGFSMHRRGVPTLDDLTFVPCTLSRVPLEGYLEKCETRTVLRSRFAENPIVLDRPITIAGMSYGALSAHA